MSTDLSSITKPAANLGKQIGRYRGLLYFVFIATICAFIIYRINVLSSTNPDQSSISQAVSSTAQPHIDPSVVDKIQKLQDNSTNVQSLFIQARQNPFQE